MCEIYISPCLTQMGGSYRRHRAKAATVQLKKILQGSRAPLVYRNLALWGGNACLFINKPGPQSSLWMNRSI